MKYHFLLFPSLILLKGCISYLPTETYIGGWKELNYAFTESIQHNSDLNLLNTITSYKWCCGTGKDEYSDKKFEWLRNPKNLWSTYNTLKKIGLESFITKSDYNKTLFEDDYWDYDWEGHSLNRITQNLIKTYSLNIDTLEYYNKFWNRRRNEKNEEITYQILLDIDAYYNQGNHSSVETNCINDTIYNLINLNLLYNKSDSTNIFNNTISYFDYLKDLNLNHSAYNLIFELDKTPNINKDSLLNTLSYDTIPEEKYWQTRNSATWLRTYRDNGP